MRVLVVEDDFTSRVLLQSLLLEFGTVHIAVDGVEAIQAFCEARQSGQPYDLICMDVRMPEMNGMDALEQIRMIEAQGGVSPSAAVKIFMTTAVRDLKTVSASFKALCDAYLPKPLDTAKLISEMHQHGLIA
ncbi:MAG: response regulator [Acidobacteria bacterium]|nr:response regulator [Acidobacteriota bacterium]